MELDEQHADWTRRFNAWWRHYHYCTDCGGDTSGSVIHDCPARPLQHPYRGG